MVSRPTNTHTLCLGLGSFAITSHNSLVGQIHDHENTCNIHPSAHPTHSETPHQSPQRHLSSPSHTHRITTYIYITRTKKSINQQQQQPSDATLNAPKPHHIIQQYSCVVAHQRTMKCRSMTTINKYLPKHHASLLQAAAASLHTLSVCHCAIYDSPRTFCVCGAYKICMRLMLLGNMWWFILFGMIEVWRTLGLGQG